MIVKERLEDFWVEEVLDLSIKERGDYSYFILQKTNWTTLKAIEFIANQLHINVKRFAVAGQKDRRGITRQFVSAYQVSERQLRQIRLKDIRIEFVGYGDTPIALGQLRGNRFRLVVRVLDKPLRQITSFVNYYDEQRFGGYRPNLHLVGKAVLQRRYEDAVKLLLLHPFSNETPDYVAARKNMEDQWGTWDRHIFPKQLIGERKIVGYLEKHPTDFKGALKSLPRQLFTMLTQAYQSYLFNESLARYLRSKYTNHREVPYAVGTLVFVDEYIDIDWPIVGYASRLTGDARTIIEGLMKEEGIGYETFKCEIPALASEGLTRKAMVKVENFSLGEFVDGVQEVFFFLPKGSYATMVMKALESHRG